MSARRGTPSVVFVDHTRWASFTQLASIVRGAGYRSIRVTSSPRRFEALVDRLVFHRVIRLNEVADVAHLGRLLAGETIVDVHVTEVMCAALPSTPDPLLPPDVAADLANKRRYLDKFEVSRVASAAGVQVPAVLDADTVTVEDAALRLGLPLVVKARVGAGGQGVRIVDSADLAAAAVTELAAAGHGVHFEQFLKGDQLGYSTVCRGGQPVRELVTRTLRNAQNGPPQEIRALDDAELMAFGRAASAALDITGPANLDLIRDGAGAVWLIDANLRVWGSMISARQFGIDLGADYLYAAGLARTPGPDVRVTDGDTCTVFPTVLDDDLATLRIRRVATTFMREGRRYREWLGTRYWLLELTLVIDRTLREVAKRVVRRR